VSGGEVAGLIVAVSWAVLVCFLAYVLVALASTLRQLTKVVGDVGDSTVPILEEVTNTVATTNLTLTRVDGITSNVSNITRNASALTAIVASGFGGPLIKAVSFSYGVRKALGGKKQRELERRVKDEMRKSSRSKRAQARKRGKAATKAVKAAEKRVKK
jgi:uncharacterized protein YoxC